MIRNVVTGRLRVPLDAEQAAADQALLERGLAGIAALEFPGLIAVHVGRDAGLRDGTWDFAITNDWADVDSYGVYDADPEHNRLRREVFGVVSAEIVRVQFVIDA